MEKDTEITKEVWLKPTLYSIDFKDTKGGTASDASENKYGTVATIS